MKKKFTLLMMLAFLGLNIGALRAQTNWGGSGTEANPYTISDIAGLEELAQKVNSSQSQSGKYFELTCDLVFPDDYGNWTPIGNVYNWSNRGFCGCFDGGGHVIRNLTIINPDADSGNGWCAALFGDVGSAVIRNIGLVDVNIRIESNYTSRVAGICAYEGSSGGFETLTIENCFVTGIIDAPNSSSVAGILADHRSSAGLVRNCFNLATITGSGLVARNYKTLSITNCYNAGIVSTVVKEESNITNCYNIGCSSARFGSVSSNCYVDKQMCTYGAEQTGVIRQLTSELLGPSIPLGADDWVYVDGLYPQLKVFAESTNPLIRAASLVSVTPVYLNSADNVDAVGVSPFTVCTGNEVSWASTGTVSLAGNTASFNQSGDAVLTVSKTVEGVVVSKEIPMYTALCWDGSGTEADPYQLVNASDLVCLAEKVNAGEHYAGVYFKMMNDIDLSGVCSSSLGSWVPIGDDFNGFKGEFDGNHKIISNLYINNSDDYNQGLFGYIKSASIKDVTVSGTVTASHSRAAGLVGLCETSEISGCVNNAIVSGYEGVGGIAGMAVSSNFSSCTNNGSISLTSQHAGGICGEFLYGSMTDCSNSGEISGPVGIGGLVGVLVPVFPIEQANGYMMSGCSNAATVTATVLAAGGVCGGIQFVESGSSVGVDDGKPYSILKDCTNSGAISCPMAVGGICGGALYPEDLPSGKSSWSSMSDWLVDGQSLLGSPAAFGVVEEMNENVLTNCTNTGKISGQNYVGGISGGLFSGGVISGCSNQGSVTAAGEMVGGVLGYANDHGNIKPQILNCSNFNNVTGKQNVAGIVGNIVDGSVSGCYNTGMISGGMFVGGVIGYGEGQTLTNSFNLGQIDGRIENAPAAVAGGVIGGSYSGHVADCYNAGMVSGYGVAGGVAGVIQFHNEDFDYDGENLYNVGQVTCVPIYDVDLGEGPLDFNYRAGISILAYESIINNCYYDKQMCTAAEPTVQYSNSGGTAGGTATNCAAMLTSAMTSEDWIPGGSAFTASNGLYPQLTAFTASPATALDQAASIVSVTPAFLNGVENVEGVATSPFTVGTGNSVSWSAASPFSYSEGEVSFSTEGTGTLTVSKTVSDITVSKDIQMTTVVDAVYWPEAVTLRPESYVDYEINTAEDLAWFASLVNGYNGQTANTFEGQIVHLNSDLDMSGYLWMPIGTYEHPFKGEFKGYDHTISGIKLDKPEGYSGIYGSGSGYSDQGLFGNVNNATISDLTIQNSKIEGYDDVGAFCGRASETTFNNCHNMSNVSLVGGYSKASVCAGGICGIASRSEFIGCSNAGTIDGSTSTSGDNLDVAGICGSTYEGASFKNCHNDGTIIEGSGICDDPDGFTIISNCYNTGTITGESSAGICFDVNGSITDCYNVGLIQGLYMASGISGEMTGTISNCFNIGDIIVTEEYPEEVAAGISGFLEEATVSNCYNTGNVSGFGIAGGLFGIVEDSNIENCYNAGQVNCVPVHYEEEEYVFDYDCRGGILGIFDTDPEVPSTITNCYYDKQMCTAPNAYYTFDEETGEFLGVPGADYQKLTTEMVGSALSSEYTDGWTFVGSGYTALYPQLTAFVESENDIDNEASLVSVRPMFLAETDNVDHVYTSPFTVGIDDDEEWSHVSGDELLTFNTDGTVEWEDYGTETVAVTNKTHDFITKQIKLNTLNLQGITWVDWVTEAPSGFNPANIDSPEDLAWFISYVNGFNDCEVHADADAMITADIDMSAHYWVPIGFYCGNICTEHQITYTGKFLGNFHNIDGIRVDWNALVNSPVLQTLAPVSSGKQNRDGNDYLGMFGSICNDTIVHVFVTSGSIVGDEDYDGGGMGGLVGCAEGSVIWNCYSNASVFQNAGSSKGGLVGVAKVYSGDDKGDDGDGEGVPTVITGSSCTADITGNGEMGGILGWSKGAVIRDCYANVKFTIQDNFGSKGHEFNSQVGCLVGASGKGFVEIYNSYVRMRGYEIIERGGGEEQAHCVGMIIGEAQGETIDHCYVPADSPYGYVGRSENVKEVFAQVPFDDGSKGDDPIFRLSVKNGGHSYYLMSLDDATDAVFQNCEQVDIEGDTYEIFEPNEEDGHLYIYNDGFDYSFYNSREGYLAVDGEGQLTYSDATPVLWNVEPNDTYGSFKLYTTPEAEQLYLGMKDGHFGVFAQGTEGCNFDIYAFMSIQMASEANIQNCGKFATTVYPYTYANPEGGNIITLDGDDDEIVESGKTTLLDALNNWDLYHSGDEDISVSMDWARFGSALNGDYPVHCYYNPDNLTEGDAVKPTAKVITTPDKTNGFPFRFYSHVGDALNYYNNLENGGILCVYGSDDMSGAAVQSNDNDVDIYVNGMTYMKCPMNEDASKDWYVSLLQGSGSTLNVHSGFYLDNSDASGQVGGGTDDWHMVSSPLAGVPVGLSYADNEQHAYGSDPVCSWNTSLDGLFPTDTPLGSYDFYAYSEPDYHWINLKQNSASHYHQDGGNEPIEYENDTELKAGHGYLIAMDKEVFMQTSGTLNNGDIEVPVTYSGAHNKGLNFLGNPYLSSLDFDKFAEANETLWEGGTYARSYITLDADKKGYITYAKGQSENPEGLSRYVWPNQGFYIAADNAGTATFTNAMRVIKTDKASYFRGEEQPNYALVNLKATDSEGNRDMLTVELGRPEVGGARKERNVRNGNGILYSHYQGGDYSVVFTEEGASQVPVWFESREDDTYTMTWSTYNGTFSYLHLIDNLTGADVDMLANAEYRYASASSDYASRFRLVFAYTGIGEEESEGEGQFVFQSGDELVVTGEGEVDIIDLNGRVIRHSRATGTQTAIAMPAVARGIYMVRLTSANGVKVNKIVVR